MPKLRQQAALRSRPLSFAEVLDLTIGTKPGHPAFASDQARREAWRLHRDERIARSDLGKRPLAYWEYEAPAELRHQPRMYRPTGSWAVLYDRSPYVCLPWDPGYLAMQEERQRVREGRWRWILAHDPREGEAEAIAAHRIEAERRYATELDRMNVCARLARQAGAVLPEPGHPHDGGEYWKEA